MGMYIMGSIHRIDFLGPSGVGKSTLYNELLKRRGKKDRWMTPIELRLKIAQLVSKRYTHSMSSRIRSVILNIRLFKVIHPLLTETVLSKHEYEYLVLWETREEEEAINNIITAIASIQFPPIFKLHRYKQIFKFAQQVALFQKHAPDNTTVVIDNSLSNEIPFLGPWNSDDAIRNLQTFFNALGGLSAVVFLDADDNLVIDRLKKRRVLFSNIAHRGMNDDEVVADTKRRLESARQFAAMFEERGVAVIRVNAGDPLYEQVKVVNEFLKQYS
jgi:thymidylate kinase